MTNSHSDLPDAAAPAVGDGEPFTEERSAEVVSAGFAGTPDPRLRQVMTSLARHLHDFVEDVEPTEEEWAPAIAFLTATGQKCDDVRQEFVLLSDVLGVSMLVETINHLFVEDSPYIDSDAVFGVKDSLVRAFPTVDDPARARRLGLPNPFRSVHFDVRLLGEEAPRRPWGGGRRTVAVASPAWRPLPAAVRRPPGCPRSTGSLLRAGRRRPDRAHGRRGWMSRSGDRAGPVQRQVDVDRRAFAGGPERLVEAESR